MMMKETRKRWMSLLLTLVMLLGLVPAMETRVEAFSVSDIDNVDLIGDQQGKWQCVAYSCLYMVRRRFALEKKSVDAGANISRTDFLSAATPDGYSVRDGFYFSPERGTNYHIEEISIRKDSEIQVLFRVC